MGSITSPPPSTSTSTPRSSSPVSLSLSSSSSDPRHGIYAVFSYREHLDDTNFTCMMGCYDSLLNTWNHECLVPGLSDNHGLKGFSMVSVGTSIYIIGGRVYRKEKVQENADESVKLTEIGVEVQSLVLRYDVIAKEWSTCAPLRTPRYDFACSVCDNKIYVAGGQATLDGAMGLSSAEVYDVLLNEWTSLPCMSTIRYKCVGVTWQRKFYVIGGFTCCRNMMFFMDRCSAEVYDDVERKWDHVRGMWQLDVPPNQIVVIDDKLLSSGDCLNVWKGQIETYDGTLNLWYPLEGSRKKDLLSLSCSFNGSEGGSFEPRQRICLTMAPIGSYLYFISGYRMASDTSSCCTISMVHRFDTSASGNQWETFESMKVDGERELCSHCCVVQFQ